MFDRNDLLALLKFVETGDKADLVDRLELLLDGPDKVTYAPPGVEVTEGMRPYDVPQVEPTPAKTPDNEHHGKPDAPKSDGLTTKSVAK